MNRLHILFTTEEGGYFEYTQGDTDANTRGVFEHFKKEGYIALRTGDAEPKKRKLAYIMLVRAIDTWDFQIKKQR